MPDIKEIASDPEFRQLPWEEQRKGFIAIDPLFGTLPKEEQDKGIAELTGQTIPVSGDTQDTQDTFDTPAGYTPHDVETQTSKWERLNWETVKDDIPYPEDETKIKNSLSLSSTFDINPEIAYEYHDYFAKELNEPGFYDKAIGSVNAGVGNIYSNVGYGLKMVGYNPYNLSQKLIDYGERLRQTYIPPNIETKKFGLENLLPSFKEREVSDWERYTNPEWLALHTIAAVPATLSLIPAAIVGAYMGGYTATAMGLGAMGRWILSSLGSSLLSTPIESAMEASQAYETAIKQQKSHEESREIARNVFEKNMLLLSGSNALGFGMAFRPVSTVSSSMIPFLAKRIMSSSGNILGTGIMEGFVEERLQETFQMEAEGKKVSYFDLSNDRLNDASVIGAIYGIGLGGVGSVWTNFVEDIASDMPESSEKIYHNAKNYAKDNGLSDKQAEVAGLETVYATPEGKAHIEQKFNELKERAKDVSAPQKVSVGSVNSASEIGGISSTDSISIETAIQSIVEKDSEITDKDVDDLIVDTLSGGDVTTETLREITREIAGETTEETTEETSDETTKETTRETPGETPARFFISNELLEQKLKDIKTKLGGIHSGVDPTILADMAIVGAGYIERGTRSFIDWSAKMIDTFGKQTVPYIEDLWIQSKRNLKEQIPRKKLKEFIRQETRQNKNGEYSLLKKEIKRIAIHAREAYKAGNVEGKKNESEKLKNILGRAKKIRAIRDFFELTDHDMKKISQKNPLLMSQYEFKIYTEQVHQKAVELSENKAQKSILMSLIVSRNYRNVENYRKALKLPEIEKMTTEQIIQFSKALEPFQYEDVFLTERQLETIDQTDFKGIKTFREAKEKIAEKIGTTAEELSKIKVSEFDKYRWDASLVEKNPLYKAIVFNITKKMLAGDIRAHEVENEVFRLAKASNKSRDIDLIGKLIPQDKLIMQFLETPEDKRQPIVDKMTPEQLDYANYIQQYLVDALEYLIKTNVLDEGISNYFTHIRRGLLENIKEDGLVKAVESLFENYKLDEEVFNILSGKTHKNLAYHKFFKFSLHRTGELVPSENITNVFMTYVKTFERMRSFNEIIPELQVWAMAITPQKMTPRGLEFDTSMKDFIFSYINNKKGRTIDWISKQGGKIDMVLNAMRTFISYLDLGFNLGVNLTLLAGEQAVTLQHMGTRLAAKGIYRMNTEKGKRIIKKYEAFTSRTIWKELMSPDKFVTQRLHSAVFSIFHEASRLMNQEFLLGNMTDAEYNNEELSIDRLAALKIEMGRYRSISGMQSLVGSTQAGKVFTQYKSWAIPAMRTNIKNIRVFLSNASKLDRDTFTSKEARELGRLVAITTTALIVRAITMGDEGDDDDTFLGKTLKKTYQETLSSINSMDSKLWLITPRVISFLTELANNVSKILSLEDAKTGAKRIGKQFVPAAVKQFIPKKSKEGIRMKDKKYKVAVEHE